MLKPDDLSDGCCVLTDHPSTVQTGLLSFYVTFAMRSAKLKTKFTNPIEVDITLPFVLGIDTISPEIFFYCGRVRLLHTDTRIVARHVGTFVFINTTFLAAKTVKTRTGVVKLSIHAYSIVAWY